MKTLCNLSVIFLIVLQLCSCTTEQIEEAIPQTTENQSPKTRTSLSTHLSYYDPDYIVIDFITTYGYYVKQMQYYTANKWVNVPTSQGSGIIIDCPAKLSKKKLPSGPISFRMRELVDYNNMDSENAIPGKIGEWSIPMEFYNDYIHKIATNVDPSTQIAVIVTFNFSPNIPTVDELQTYFSASVEIGSHMVLSVSPPRTNTGSSFTDYTTVPINELSSGSTIIVRNNKFNNYLYWNDQYVTYSKGSIVNIDIGVRLNGIR